MNECVEQLKEWLRVHAGDLRSVTLSRAPNLLVSGEAVEAFLSMLTTTAGEQADTQLAAVQAWAVATSGDDPRLANDWLTLLRLLKDLLFSQLCDELEPSMTLRYWRELDPIFNHAFVEVTRLAREPDRANYLEHMSELRRQFDRLNRSKANFVAVAAHELKTPLSLLEGYAEMVRSELPDRNPRLEKYLAGFHNGTQRLRIIVEDMLDVSQLDAQSLDLHFQAVYLTSLLDTVVEAQTSALGGRDVILTVETVEVTGPIFADPIRLAQALTKILENAVKYTPDGGRVYIRALHTRQDEATADVDGYVDVQVCDTGIGIEHDQLTAIFDKFVTTRDLALHSTSKTRFKGGGPGLGLPIARGIVEAHGGRVWAESDGYDEQNCPGSVFHVELPVRTKLPH